MIQTILANKVSIRNLIDYFGLELVRDEKFFPEWQIDLPPVTIAEQEQLDRIVDDFSNLLEYPPLLEDLIRMSVVDPFGLITSRGSFMFVKLVKNFHPQYATSKL